MGAKKEEGVARLSSVYEWRQERIRKVYRRMKRIVRTNATHGFTGTALKYFQNGAKFTVAAIENPTAANLRRAEIWLSCPVRKKGGKNEHHYGTMAGVFLWGDARMMISRANDERKGIRLG